MRRLALCIMAAIGFALFPAGARAATVLVASDFAPQPAELSVEVGERVSFWNRGPGETTVTGPGGYNQTLGAGEASTAFAARRPGTYVFSANGRQFTLVVRRRPPPDPSAGRVRGIYSVQVRVQQETVTRFTPGAGSSEPAFTDTVQVRWAARFRRVRVRARRLGRLTAVRTDPLDHYGSSEVSVSYDDDRTASRAFPDTTPCSFAFRLPNGRALLVIGGLAGGRGEFGFGVRNDQALLLGELARDHAARCRGSHPKAPDATGSIVTEAFKRNGVTVEADPKSIDLKRRWGRGLQPPLSALIRGRGFTLEGGHALETVDGTEGGSCPPPDEPCTRVSASTRVFVRMS